MNIPVATFDASIATSARISIEADPNGLTGRLTHADPFQVRTSLGCVFVRIVSVAASILDATFVHPSFNLYAWTSSISILYLTCPSRPTVMVLFPVDNMMGFLNSVFW